MTTYLDFLISTNQDSIKEGFIGDYYIKYKNTTRGKELFKKLEFIKQELGFSNCKLYKKLDILYVLKELQTKMHFIFSPEGDNKKEELREALDIMGKEGSGNLFRGQANSYWALDSSMTREPKYLENENKLYYDILSLKPDAFKNDNTVYEKLITMQHYGMPTRLLDITRNPLVAIFFACDNSDSMKHDGAIYTFSPDINDFLNFDHKRLKCLTKIVENSSKSRICSNCDTNADCKDVINNVAIEADKTTCHFRSRLNSVNLSQPDFFKKNWFVQGVAKNQRISNQSGDFIFVGLGESRSELSQLPQMTIIIDSDSKQVLLEQLETLNIHGGSVYPDITHMSEYIKNKYLKSNNEISTSNVETFEDTLDNVGKKDVDLFQRKFKLQSNSNIEFENAYDESTFWDIKNTAKLSQFTIDENLNLDNVKSVIDNYFFTTKLPLRDKVINCLIEKPPLMERADISVKLTDKIILFAKSLL